MDFSEKLRDAISYVAFLSANGYTSSESISPETFLPPLTYLLLIPPTHMALITPLGNQDLDTLLKWIDLEGA